MRRDLTPRRATILQVPGFGSTWSKMLIASVDIRFPDLGLLRKSCDVGADAFDSMKVMLLNRSSWSKRSPCRARMGIFYDLTTFAAQCVVAVVVGLTPAIEPGSTQASSANGSSYIESVKHPYMIQCRGSNSAVPADENKKLPTQ